MPEGLTLTAWLFASAWAGTAVLAIYLYARLGDSQARLRAAESEIEVLNCVGNRYASKMDDLRDDHHAVRVSRERLQQRAAELSSENEALREELRACRLQLESAGVDRSAVVLPSGERIPAEGAA